MGCLPSKVVGGGGVGGIAGGSKRDGLVGVCGGGRGRGLRVKRPRWKADCAMTEAKLKSMREEFWDTQPHYGGDRVIWDALKAIVEADNDMRKIIIDSAGIIVDKDDLSVCYDERGWKYELPKYVLSDPTNLIREKNRGDTQMVRLSVQS